MVVVKGWGTQTARVIILVARCAARRVGARGSWHLEAAKKVSRKSALDHFGSLALRS